MRIFSAFSIIVAAFFLLVLDITQATHDFETQVVSNSFEVETVAGQTTANTTLLLPLFENDTTSISYTSSVAEVPAVSTYNSTNRQLLTSGLDVSANRTLVVSYDVNALVGFSALSLAFDFFPYIWYIMIMAFIGAGVLAIFTAKG